MPYNIAAVRSRIVLAKAATIADWDQMQPYLNASAWTLDANGASVTSSASSGVQILVGGFNDQKITASMKFITPTTAGNENIGVMCRFFTNQSGYATYYFARQQKGIFRLQKVVDGTFTTLSSNNYTLAQNTWATFVLQVVGSALSASIDDGTTSLSLTATDSAIAGPGCFGFRSGPTDNSTVSCRSFTVEEV
jgi:hypothetical protein